MILPDQPAPTKVHGDVWADLLRATPMPRDLRILCRERRPLGIARYGTPLQLDNGRDMRRDAREEALDLPAYLWGVSYICAREGVGSRRGGGGWWRARCWWWRGCCGEPRLREPAFRGDRRLRQGLGDGQAPR